MRRRALRRRGSRGAIIVELSIVAPVLVLLLLGMFEFGMAFRDMNIVKNANRAGARTAASQGAKGTSDYYALQAVKAGLSSLKGVTINRIVIYNATTNTTPDPTCLSLTPPGGISGTRACNVYTAESLTLSSSAFSSSGSTCSGTAVDRYYCPLTRAITQSSGTDYLGIYISIDRPTFTKFVANPLTVKDKFIVRLEPA